MKKENTFFNSPVRIAGILIICAVLVFTTIQVAAGIKNNNESQREEIDKQPIAADKNDKAEVEIISIDEAKKAALGNAGVSESEATFTKSNLDIDDGMKIYEIEFYTQSKEYDYEIDALTGEIREKDIEGLEQDDVWDDDRYEDWDD